MQNNRKFIFYMILLWFFRANGYVYKLSILKKNNNILIGFSDYHDRDNVHNYSQREDFILLLKSCNSKNTKIIVEDLSSVNNDGHMMCCNYSINGEGGFLAGLANIARQHNFMVDNVEFRYCRVIALGPLLHTSSFKDEIQKNRITKISDMSKEINYEIEKIRKYDDGKLLNSMYKKIIQDTIKNMGRMYFDEKNSTLVADYCKSRFSSSTYMSQLQQLCVFDCGLIDANILHSVVTAQDKKIIFVVAGGSHIEKMNIFLQKLGYKNVWDSSYSTLLEDTMRSALECVMHSNQGIVETKKPVPISLKNVHTHIIHHI